MKYYIIAGEASGDLHGSNLIKGLRHEDTEAQIRFYGGDMMAEAAGTAPVRHYKETAVMGFVEVLGNLKKILGNLSECRRDIMEFRPDIIILIDYPGFNLKIAKFAKENGFRVFYYISPKVWAWKEGRVKKMKKYIDRLFIIFPFEIGYFRKKGIDAVYEGNPLLDSISEYRKKMVSEEEFRKRASIREGMKNVTILAGSRKMEIKYLLPKALDVVMMNRNMHFTLAAAPSIDDSVYEEIIVKHCGRIPGNMSIVKNSTYDSLVYSQAAIISSGTASLEAAILKVPQVVCYGGNEISYRIARHFVKTRFISLANLILDKGIFRELIQHDCTPENINTELQRLLNDSGYRNGMLDDYEEVIERLGGYDNPEPASYRFAKRMIGFIKEN